LPIALGASEAQRMAFSTGSEEMKRTERRAAIRLRNWREALEIQRDMLVLNRSTQHSVSGAIAGETACTTKANQHLPSRWGRRFRLPWLRTCRLKHVHLIRRRPPQINAQLFMMLEASKKLWLPRI